MGGDGCGGCFAVLCLLAGIVALFVCIFAGAGALAGFGSVGVAIGGIVGFFVGCAVLKALIGR